MTSGFPMVLCFLHASERQIAVSADERQRCRGSHVGSDVFEVNVEDERAKLTGASDLLFALMESPKLRSRVPLLNVSRHSSLVASQGLLASSLVQSS